MLPSRGMCALAIVSLLFLAACNAGKARVENPAPPKPPSQDTPETVTPPAPPPPVSAPAQAPMAFGSGIAGGVAGGIAGGVGFRAGAERFITEAYDRIDDNGWKLVAADPLSTFSVDVDTASYSNLRRMLNAGQPPPKDAVRIEELINYFAYDYPSPDGTRPFSVTTEVGPCPWAPEHRLLLVGLQGRRLDTARMPARNLVFLIDVSGSMQDSNKLPLVKASLAMLAGHLGDRDRVAIVVYAGASGLVLPSTPGSDRERILAAISQLEAGGSTNGAQGIELAYRTAREHFNPDGVNRVILATDGDFNVGITDRGSLVRLIEEKRRAGIALTVLGYGMGNLKDATLEQLADRGNGNYAYIDSAQEAQKVLVEQAGGTLVTIAKDVKLQLEFNPTHVGAFRLIGYENRVLQHQDFKNDAKDAGDIGAGHSVTALYELVPASAQLPAGADVDPLKYQRPAASASDSPEWLTVKLRYKAPQSDTSEPMDVAVTPDGRRDASLNLRFASAVAAFGMTIRESEFRGQATYAMARDLAQGSRGEDRFGHRAEFLRLIDIAAGIATPTSNGQPIR